MQEKCRSVYFLRQGLGPARAIPCFRLPFCDCFWIFRFPPFQLRIDTLGGNAYLHGDRGHRQPVVCGHWWLHLHNTDGHGAVQREDPPGQTDVQRLWERSGEFMLDQWNAAVLSVRVGCLCAFFSLLCFLDVGRTNANSPVGFVWEKGEWKQMRNKKFSFDARWTTAITMGIELCMLRLEVILAHKSTIFNTNCNMIFFSNVLISVEKKWKKSSNQFSLHFNHRYT